MLPKSNRLTKEKDFQEVFKKGKAIKSDFLLFRVLKNNLNTNRFGFIVSKKVSSKATTRNKIKRRLRGVVAAELKNIKGFKDFVIVALPSINKKEFLQVKEKIVKFFETVK